jgi:hypothetical protein
MDRLLIIGDIHGCSDELVELVETAQLDSSDLIATVGDLWSMGPKPKEVLAYAKEKNMIATLGNHDVQHLLADFAGRRPTLIASANIAYLQAGPKVYAEFVEYLSDQPRAIVTPYCNIVHASIDPRLPLEEQDPATMMGEDSSLDSKVKQELGKYWYEAYNWHLPAVTGHTHFNKVRKFGFTSKNENDPFDWVNPGGGRVIGLDTGCVNGGRLTGILFSPENPQGEFISVAAKENHWAKLRQEYGVNTPPLTLSSMTPDQMTRWVAYRESMGHRLDEIKTIDRVRLINDRGRSRLR